MSGGYIINLKLFLPKTLRSVKVMSMFWSSLRTTGAVAGMLASRRRSCNAIAYCDV